MAAQRQNRVPHRRAQVLHESKSNKATSSEIISFVLITQKIVVAFLALEWTLHDQPPHTS